MAEKEERILICTRYFSEQTNMTHTGMFKEYTRQEAIRKISSHLLMCDISTMDTDEISQVALNAILED